MNSINLNLDIDTIFLSKPINELLFIFFLSALIIQFGMK